jgi:hypothetical protein
VRLAIIGIVVTAICAFAIWEPFKLLHNTLSDIEEVDV